ncbi:MAG: hypothetical protein AAF202_06220 [Pseudomonadota bacterium]
MKKLIILALTAAFALPTFAEDWATDLDDQRFGAENGENQIIRRISPRIRELLEEDRRNLKTPPRGEVLLVQPFESGTTHTIRRYRPIDNPTRAQVENFDYSQFKCETLAAIYYGYVRNSDSYPEGEEEAQAAHDDHRSTMISSLHETMRPKACPQMNDASTVMDIPADQLLSMIDFFDGDCSRIEHAVSLTAGSKFVHLDLLQIREGFRLLGNENSCEFSQNMEPAGQHAGLPHGGAEAEPGDISTGFQMETQGIYGLENGDRPADAETR